MTRSRQALVLPLGMAFFMIIAFIVGGLYPNLDPITALPFGLFAVVVIIFADRLSARKLAEPRSDERLEGFGRRAAMIAMRISIVASAAFIVIVICAFPGNMELKFVAIGANLMVALQSLIIGIVWKVMERRG